MKSEGAAVITLNWVKTFDTDLRSAAYTVNRSSSINIEFDVFDPAGRMYYQRDKALDETYPDEPGRAARYFLLLTYNPSKAAA